MRKTGTELRQAREHTGLSAEQIAERTKIKLHKVVALEEGDFERLPQGIYLDGIVRAYAHEVGIDPEPMVERVRLERGKLPGDTPIAFHEPVQFERASPPQSSAAAEHVPARVPRPQRRLVPALAALVALAAVLGLAAYLYQGTRAFDRDTLGKFFASSAEPTVPREAAPRPAVPQRVETAGAVQVETAAVATAGAIQDVSGAWELATQVESTSYARFAGLLLGYEIQLEQAGDRVTGLGRKVIENGDRINPRAQTPISVSGIVDGDRVALNFTERGSRRSTTGAFVLRMDQDGALRGRFSSDAAQSSGRVEARRGR